jgi:hypothetical protein
VSPLTYAGNDADAVTSALKEELDFPPTQVINLKDESATKQAILDTFLSFREKAHDPDDRVIVFFAGHGKTEQGLHGPIGYLVPVDGDPRNLSTLIRWDDLTRNADLINAKHILFIMDACYSGLAMQRAIPPGTQRFLSDVLQRLARQVITAGKADETVADGGGPQGKNSIFTGYLLEGLRGAAADEKGVLTANGLMYYVYQKVGLNARSQQTPHYGHIEGDGDFVLRTPNKEHLETDSQQDFLVKTVIEAPEAVTTIGAIPTKLTFAERNGYSDPSHPSFGRNDWSSKLGEQRFIFPPYPELPKREMSKAFSWLSLILEPVADLPGFIDIEQEGKGLLKLQPFGDQPFEQFEVPGQLMTTIDSAILFSNLDYDNVLWGRYLRVDETGNTEYADTKYAFCENKGTRCFGYVQIIGEIWQFMFLSKHLLAKVNYRSGARLLINLVGTRDTILANFSQEDGKNASIWSDPFGHGSSSLLDLKCRHLNLQMQYQLVIGDLGEQNSREIINNVARKLGLAYNHQSSPRCYNFDTDIFPWSQYLGRRWQL